MSDKVDTPLFCRFVGATKDSGFFMITIDPQSLQAVSILAVTDLAVSYTINPQVMYNIGIPGAYRRAVADKTATAHNRTIFYASGDLAVKSTEERSFNSNWLALWGIPLEVVGFKLTEDTIVAPRTFSNDKWYTEQETETYPASRFAMTFMATQVPMTTISPIEEGSLSEVISKGLEQDIAGGRRSGWSHKLAAAYKPNLK